MTTLFLSIAAVVWIAALAAKDIGSFVSRFGLPVISGFIITGVLVGPDVLGLLQNSADPILNIIDSIALPFITLAAGAELNLDEIKKRFKSISIILTCIVVFAGGLGGLSVVLMAPYIPFLHDQSIFLVISAALVTASILPAKSCSSLIAIVKELRARGPLVQTALGITVLMDSVIIILFAISKAAANILIESGGFQLSELCALFFELSFDIGFGLAFGVLIRSILKLGVSGNIKISVILLTGFGLMTLSQMDLAVHLFGLHLKLPAEPLLECMIAGIFVSNMTKYGAEFQGLLDRSADVIFLFFFTSLGASLDVGVLESTWHIALMLVLVRGVGMFAGCYVGGLLTPEKFKSKHLLGFAFITQAGISLSLAKAAASTYPGWGEDLATLLIAVIVTNTIIGPTFTKWALVKAGESRLKAPKDGSVDSRSVLIVGIDDQAFALYRQLESRGFQVTLATMNKVRFEQFRDFKGRIAFLEEITLEKLRNINAHKMNSLVVMLDNDRSYRICEIAYEHFGTEDIVVRLEKPDDANRFYEIGALVVEPGTAIVSLLYHYVRSPAAALLFLGKEDDKGVAEFTITNPNLHGLALRNIHLPTDVLILAVRRSNEMLFSHGYTVLRLGDEITAVGTTDSLDDLRVKFET